MSGRAVIGVILILLGIGYLLDQLFQLSIVATWWPLLIVLVGVNRLIRYPERPWWPLVIVAFGALLQVQRLAGWSINLWALVWAGVLLVLGVWLVMPRHARRAVIRQFSLPRNTDVLDEYVSFDDRRLRIESTQFRGGSVVVSFGAVQLDLRGATLAADGALLEVSAAFGAVEILAPEGWPLVITSNTLLGACENHARNTVGEDTPPPILHLRCQTVLGSVEIRN